MRLTITTITSIPVTQSGETVSANPHRDVKVSFVLLWYHFGPVKLLRLGFLHRCHVDDVMVQSLTELKVSMRIRLHQNAKLHSFSSEASILSTFSKHTPHRDTVMMHQISILYSPKSDHRLPAFFIDPPTIQQSTSCH